MLLKLKGPLQRCHSLSDAIIMMDRSVVGLPSCPWGPVGLSDLCEATGGSFNSELGEMSPQFHQLGGQNCIYTPSHDPFVNSLSGEKVKNTLEDAIYCIIG